MTGDNARSESSTDRRSRRAVLQFVAGVSAIAASGHSVSAADPGDGGSAEQPAPHDYEDLLDQMAGDGTPDTPYVITDVRELQAMAGDPAANYVLGDDIDASSTSDWDDGAGFDPVGTFDRPFTGSLDGRGRTIQNLTIDRPGERNAGLIGSVNWRTSHDDVTIQNLTISEATVNGGYHTGIVVGHARDAAVAQVRATGTVTGTRAVGGLAGNLKSFREGEGGVTVTNCAADCTVSGENEVGGLVGYLVSDGLSEMSVSKSTAAGSIHGYQDVGGLLGAVVDRGNTDVIRIEHCSASASVADGSDPEPYVEERTLNRVSDFGGLVGILYNARVRHSTATGDVTATAGAGFGVGGLVGQVTNTRARVVASSATGDVSGREAVGGLIGAAAVRDAQSDGGSGAITTSAATGSVEGMTDVGGAVGSLLDTSLEDIIARGAVHGQQNVGGLVGAANGVFVDDSIKRTLATGMVQGETNVGGVFGDFPDGTVASGYWDHEATGQASSPGVPDSNGVPTSALTGSAAKSTLEEFDFETVWQTSPDSYPRLRTVGPQGTVGQTEELQTRIESNTSTGDGPVTRNDSEAEGRSLPGFTTGTLLASLGVTGATAYYIRSRLGGSEEATSRTT